MEHPKVLLVHPLLVHYMYIKVSIILILIDLKFKKEPQAYAINFQWEKHTKSCLECVQWVWMLSCVRRLPPMASCYAVLLHGVKIYCFKCIAQNERKSYPRVENGQANMLLQRSCFSQKMEVPSPTGSLLPSPLGQGPAWDYSPTCQAVWRLLHTMGQVWSADPRYARPPEWPPAGMGLYKWPPAGEELVCSLASGSTIHHSSLSKWQTGRPRCLGQEKPSRGSLGTVVYGVCAAWLGVRTVVGIAAFGLPVSVSNLSLLTLAKGGEPDSEDGDFNLRCLFMGCLAWLWNGGFAFVYCSLAL